MTTILKEGLFIGRRKTLNFFAGENVTLSLEENGDVINITIAASGSGSGGVTSFNGRTGAVEPTSGDYNASQVTNAVNAGQPNTFAGPQTFSTIEYPSSGFRIRNGPGEESVIKAPGGNGWKVHDHASGAFLDLTGELGKDFRQGADGDGGLPGTAWEVWGHNSLVNPGWVRVTRIVNPDVSAHDKFPVFALGDPLHEITVATLPAFDAISCKNGSICWCADAKNFADNGNAVGTPAIAGGQGAHLGMVNGQWRTLD